MKKAILVGLLLVFAWTSAVGAEEIGLLVFLKSLDRPPAGTLQALDGHVWCLMTDEDRNAIVGGFLIGVNVVTGYLGHLTVSIPPYVSAMNSWKREAAEAIVYLLSWRFSVSDYVAGIDELYADTNNRDILLSDAIFIVNERLNGREVGLVPWRNKHEKREGT